MSDSHPPISIEDLYQLYVEHPSVCTDTRKIQKGDLFFALKGEHFNGNQYAIQALEKGAAYAIVDEEISNARYPEQIIRVDDALVCLQKLSAFHRDQFNIPFIAITGSNGKTTTKELIHAVLSEKYLTYTTEGNLNNHIGIPLTLLKIKKDAEMAIVEMGANHLGEIAGYCVYTKPTHGIITNCGKAHLEGFGSIEGVRKGKGELYDYLRDHNGTAFIMWDYDYLREMSKNIREIVTYGSTGTYITGLEETAVPYLRVRITAGEKTDFIQTQLTGNYNLPNVLAAVAVGYYFHVDPASVKRGIEKYSPSNNRSQLIRNGTNTIIMDAYNANPSSMKVAIDNFSHYPVKDKILLLGAMAELGSSGPAEHEEIIRQIGTKDWKEVILVGGDFLQIKHPYLTFRNAAEAGKWLSSHTFQNTAFLVKGSRSIQMEKVAESIK